MRVVISVLIFGFGLFGCVEQVEKSIPYGLWKSDAPRTLAEMRQAKEQGLLSSLTLDQNNFYNTNFFGRLEVLTEEGRSKSWFTGEDSQLVEWDTYIAEHIGGNKYLITTILGSNGDQIDNEIEFMLNGKCYKVMIKQLGFHEWFCLQ